MNTKMDSLQDAIKDLYLNTELSLKNENDQDIKNYMNGALDSLNIVMHMIKIAKEPKKMIKECECCGLIFNARTSNQRICSDCQKEKKAKLMNDKLLEKSRKEIEKEQKAVNKRIELAAKIQKKTGLSYGQQQAQKFLIEEKEKKVGKSCRIH